MANTVLIDITSLAGVNYITGIQRVVREFTLRLLQSDIQVELVVGDARHPGFRVVDKASYRQKMADMHSKLKYTRRLALADIGAGYCLLDLDGVWNLTNVTMRRQNLYRTLRANGARIGTFIHDVIPILLPQYCGEDAIFRFPLYLAAVLEYADFIITTTQETQNRVRFLISQTGTRHRPFYVVPLGSDINRAAPGKGRVGEQVLKATGKGPYLLILGTLEPRKNHRYLLDAYDAGLKDLPVNIVIAGRVGWHSQDLLERIRHHEALGKRLFFLEGPSDAEVDHLYANAYAVVFPTFDEGFGLPVIEALDHGKPVFASDIGVMREVGKDCVSYFDLKDPHALASQIRYFWEHPEEYAKICEKVQHFKALSWDEAAVIMADVLKHET